MPVRIGWENRKWGRNAISYILSNERYIGNSLWQKTYATNNLPTRYIRNHGECAQYYAERTHPPIIDPETFQAAQMLRKQRQDERISDAWGQESPLRQKLYCGVCGTVFKRRKCGETAYWVCRVHFGNKDNCPVPQISGNEIHAAFLRLYHKLRLHGEPILTQMISNLQAIQERRMLWILDIIDLNKKISDIMDQDQMLTRMNQCGCVDPDTFISQGNELARQLREAKQKKERLMAKAGDDTIPRTQELLEALETMPEFLPAFDGEIFDDLVDGITADDNNTLRFRLKNGLELMEHIKQRG